MSGEHTDLEYFEEPQAGPWWRWLLMYPGGWLVFIAMAFYFRWSLSTAFPNSDFLWMPQANDSLPLGYAIANIPATFVAIVSAAYLAPNKHFMASVIFAAPLMLIALVWNAGYVAFFDVVVELGLGSVVRQNLEVLLLPGTIVLTWWLVRVAERRPPAKPGWSAWKVFLGSIVAVTVGVPIMWLSYGLPFIFHLWIASSLSATIANVVVWAIVIVFLIPVTFGLHATAGSIAWNLLSRLPSRVAVLVLVALAWVVNMVRLLRIVTDYTSR